MSDGKVQIEFGGKVDGSYDSSVEHIRNGQREVAKEYAKTATEIALTVGSTYATHKAKHEAMAAGWAVVRVAAQRSLATIISYAPQVAGGLALITGGVTALRGVMRLLNAASDEVQVGLGQVAAQEDLVSKLKVLTGGVDAAKSKLKELAATFRGTTLELPEVVDTYRSTQVQTGGALSDKKGLTMLGDVAAASGNSLKDTGDAIGKLYGDLQAGAPINDATDKLKEMGIVSAEVTQRIYTLQSEGKSGAEIWAYLSGQLEKSSGAMQAAADNLTTLQKALVDAKNRLHELFAEASAGANSGGEDEGLKKEIKGQIDTLVALQPVAEEAGGLYATLRSLLSDTIAYWTGNTAAVKQHTGALNDENTSLLRYLGDLKDFVDVGAAAGVGLAVFLIGLIPIGAALLFAGGAAALFVTGITAIAAVLTAAATGFVIYLKHAEEADKRLFSLIQSNQELVNGLKKQEAAIVSVTDKILFLAKAYEALDAAREGLANAKTPEEKEQYEQTIKRILMQIGKAERKDDDKLKPTEARAKSEKATKDAQDEVDDLGKDPKAKYEDALSEVAEARKRQFELREKYAQAQKDAAPGGAASDAVIDPQIEAARRNVAESREREGQSRALAKQLSFPGNEKNAAVFLDEADKEKGIQETEHQRALALEGFRRGREQRVESARGELAAQDTVVTTANKGLLTSQKAAEEYQAKLRQLEIEKQIASLQEEGLTRAQEEWGLKRAGLEEQLQVASRDPDKTKSGAIEKQIAEGDAALKKQEEAFTLHARELEDERKIAALKSDGLTRAREEWAIRRAGLEYQLQNTHGDVGKVDEITTKIGQGDAAIQKDEKADAASQREIEAEEKIALLQSEGIQRAREESEIRLGLIEARWKAAEDDTAREKERAAYIKEQAEMARKVREDDKAYAAAARASTDATDSRRDAAAKRELERRFREGQITDEERRKGEARLVRREGSRLRGDAAQKDQEADEASQHGDDTKALQLRREAESLRAQADAKRDEHHDLLHPEQKRQTPIADELQRIGGGGSAYYGAGKNPLEAKTDELIRVNKEVLRELKSNGKTARSQKVL